MEEKPLWIHQSQSRPDFDFWFPAYAND